MTTFPITEPSARSADHTVPYGRWALHRAGIVNVWQYDRVEFAFGGGRLLLRGKNGAGKSKALEVLLPFLLDGDSRHLDASGRDRTTVKWLMTADRPDGNHVGYVWLELRRLSPDGEQSFLTIGAGLKASTATGRTDTWFFITERRVGADLHLDEAGECLSIDRLKQAVGEEAVAVTGAEHRRRVGRHLFGLFDEARYDNLLHLLHRLRDPNIGNRVEAGELAIVLADALPPIDDRVLADAASRFDDLESIREQVERSDRTAHALGQFLGIYRGYTRTVVNRRAVAVAGAEAARAKAERLTRQVTRVASETAQAAAEAQVALDALRRERTDREGERRELERSDGYRAHQDLVDRQERVNALEDAARIAESAAGRAGDALRRAEADVVDARADVSRSLGALNDAAATFAGLAADAGLDVSLLGSQTSAADDGTVGPEDMAVADQRARAARTLSEARQRRASEVRTLAVKAERAASDADAADERAAVSEAAVDHERTQHAGARVRHDEAERAWGEAVRAWTGTRLAGSCGAAWDAVVQRLADRGDEGWSAHVRQGVVEALRPVLDGARQGAAAADLAVASADDDLAGAETRLAEVEAEPEARPAPGRHRDAVRDPAAGAPFYELVEVNAAVTSSDAAGIEAALEAAGLLDAWVWADGLVVHGRTHDTLLRADPAPCADGVATLTSALRAAPGPGCPVGAATVEAVLGAVALGAQSDGVWVNTDGRWSLGPLQGAWAKDTVEYLGAGARRATRQRLVRELRAVVAARQVALSEARMAAAAAADLRDALESLPGELPSAQPIDQAWRDMVACERSLGAAESRHDTDRRRAEQARAIANRLAASVAHEAAGDGLPTAAAELDAVVAAIGELRQVLGDHRRALLDLGRANERLEACAEARAERAGEAAQTGAEASLRRADHHGAAHELATLRAALGASVDAVLAQHRLVCSRLTELDDTLVPQAEQAHTGAVAAKATAESRLEQAEAAERGAADTVAACGRALAVAVVLPGVMLAACGREVRRAGDLVPGDPGRGPVGEAVALAAAVGPLVDGDDEVADSLILARYDRLNEALAGGYDTAMEEHDGVKVVHVDDDTGRQPLAAVAARLAEEAQAAKGRLVAREREVLERFLLRELADEVRTKLLDANDLVSGTNRTLAGVTTSHGKGAHLEWRLRDDAAAPAAVAARLLVDELRDDGGDAALRDALLQLIEAERAVDPTGGYEQHLRAALDYRAWHRFTVKVTDTAQPGSQRTLSSRLGLSQGEQRVLSYLALFAAAAAHFDAVARDAPRAPRLLLLDDAFAKVDEPTHGQLLGLLVDLGLDFVITSERLWGCFPTVPSLEIYEAIRDPAEPGVALVHFRWDGHHRHLVGV